VPELNEPYIRKEFARAVSTLATGPEPLPQRVRNAMEILVMFTPKNMPDKWSRQIFAQLDFLATERLALADEGDLAATIESMASKEVQELAQLIVDLYSHLLRRLEPRYAADQEPAGDEES
jgi:hypothetical protein